MVIEWGDFILNSRLKLQADKGVVITQQDFAKHLTSIVDVNSEFKRPVVSAICVHRWEKGAKASPSTQLLIKKCL